MKRTEIMGKVLWPIKELCEKSGNILINDFKHINDFSFFNILFGNITEKTSICLKFFPKYISWLFRLFT